MITNRTRYTLKAPDGVTESLILGLPYWPDDEGEVTTASPEHRDILKQHGYVQTAEVSIMPPATVRGPIEVDEMGRSMLAAALQERGVSFPAEADRPMLADIAAAWNAARVRARGAQITAEAITPAAAAAPAPVATITAPPAPPAGSGVTDAEVDFTKESYNDLKGWLTARGVSYPANTPKVQLVEMCQKTLAVLKAAKAEPKADAA